MNAARRVPRLTIRIRLALLFAALFLVAGGALLGVTYGLMRQVIYTQQTDIAALGQPSVTASDDAPTARKMEAYQQSLSDIGQRTLTSMTRGLAIVLFGKEPL